MSKSGQKLYKFRPLLPLHVKDGCHCADCDVTKNYTTTLFFYLYRNAPSKMVQNIENAGRN